MPISRMQQPRQMYGLGSFVKKAVKGVTNAVKSVAKSDLGKAALLYAGTAGLGSLGAGGGLGSLLRGSTYLPSNVISNLGASFINFKTTPFGTAIFGKPQADAMTRSGGLLNFLKTPAGFATAAGAASLAGGMFTAKEQEDIEQLRESDPEALKGYLRRYYKNLNPNADQIEVESFVRTNAAYGGRMGFADGMPEESITPMKKPDNDVQYVRDTIKSLDGFAQLIAQEGNLDRKTFQGHMDMFEDFRQRKDIDAMPAYTYLQRRVQELNPEVAKMMVFDYSDKPNFANGGRIGYAFGSPEENAIQASGIGGLPLNQNPAGITELDLRDNGGFIPPVGVKEKADDIPAMLSNNEFVFTADAVRGMGEGDVNVGAQRMYDMMKKLENGGRV
jgi:hypothetical protein